MKNSLKNLAEKEFLIDSWFPFGEVSVESIRERAAFTALPAMYALHVWFARRPLIASRAAILYSLLQNKNKENTFKIMGFPLGKDMVLIQKQIEDDKAKGIRKKEHGYTWDRAFKHTPTDSELEWLHTELKKVWGGKLPTVMDPMAGGGSIPFEAMRLGLPVISSDLNPIAFLIQKATLEYPAKFGDKLIPAVEEFCNEIHKRAYEELKEYFPKNENEKIYAYIWARTITCQKCDLIIPLSPNWWFFRKGEKSEWLAVKLKIPKESEGNICSFEIIKNPEKIGYDPSDSTDKRKEALCPRCKTKTSGDSVKKQAQDGKMGHQMYCVYTKYLEGRKIVRNFRIPSSKEINSDLNLRIKLKEKIKNLEKLKIIPNTEIPRGLKTRELHNFGMNHWTDLFNPRQLLAHLTYLERFDEVKQEWLKNVKLDHELTKAVIVYGGFVIDGCVDYNSILTLWDSRGTKIAHTMNIQSFPFKSSYAEFDHSEMLWPWVSTKIKSVLVEILLFLDNNIVPKNFCCDAANVSNNDKSVEAIIVDPPYSENVMYAEVTDFFYVWLKKTVGGLFPNEFKNELSDKDAEAVANSS
ncbi:MAG: DUF1156 domain-containing protein, partial [Candidatus Nitrosopelagicus sp.]|nr:DUF1156 domain-containing protein [Candidatus Nitrosopelagicus sp.]